MHKKKEKRGFIAMKAHNPSEDALDENNSLIRLADSMAGFVRDVVFDGDEGGLKDLFTRVSRSGALVEVLR